MPGLADILTALGGPWLERAQRQADLDIAAYQQGGVPALMANTGDTQDLVGGFGGITERPNIKLVRAGGHSPAGGPGTYEIRDAGGTLLGRANMVVEGNTGYVDNIYSGARNPVLGATPQPNTLGPSVIREAMRQFLELNPGVTSLTGNRVSGARYGGTFNADQIGTKATVNPDVPEIERLLRLLPRLGGP